MQFINDTKISLKLLSPMVGMAGLFACVVGLGAVQLQRTTAHYAHMTEQVDPTVVRLVRLNKETAQLGYDLYKSMTTYADSSVWQDVYHADTPAGMAYVKVTLRADGAPAPRELRAEPRGRGVLGHPRDGRCGAQPSG